MNISELLTIYPHGLKQTYPATDDNYLSLKLAEATYVWLEKKRLSKQEILLLKQFFRPETIDIKAHPWFDLLFNSDTYVSNRTYRFIQFHIESTEHFLRDEWQQNVAEMFNTPADFFFYTDKDAILVEEKKTNSLYPEELNSIFLAFDEDFETTTSCFVGHFHPINQNLVALFAEERRIFTQVQPLKHTNSSIISLPDIAMDVFFTPVLASSHLAQSFYISLKNEQEMQAIIIEMWHTLGNISLTAKNLFMHRNTLHYRIEKFQESTGLNLKKADDLAFCYLLVRNKNDK